LVSGIARVQDQRNDRTRETFVIATKVSFTGLGLPVVPGPGAASARPV